MYFILGDTLYASGWLILGLGFAVCALLIAKGEMVFRTLRAIPYTLMFLGVALLWIKLASTTPALSRLDIPFVPDVDLSVVSASTSPVVGGETASPSHTFLLTTVSVKSEWGARGVELSPLHFRFLANDKSYRYEFSMYELPTHCNDDMIVPTNGLLSCSLAFEIPSATTSGTLEFNDYDHLDRTSLAF